MSTAPTQPADTPAARTTGTGILARLRSRPARPRRVLLLVAAIIVMSAGDLALTLTYLQHLGMAEMNPLARMVIGFQSPLLLAVWKLATVTACVSILLWKCSSRSAELGAWLGALILCGLMLHWRSYVRIAPPIPASIASRVHSGDERWSSLAPAGPAPRHVGVPTP